MAPTICSEKESRVRSRIRDTKKKSSNYSFLINYGGKLTHRRSLTIRNSTTRSISSSSSSASSSSSEEDTNNAIYENDISDDNMHSLMSIENKQTSSNIFTTTNSIISMDESTNCQYPHSLGSTITTDSGYTTVLNETTTCDHIFKDTSTTSSSISSTTTMDSSTTDSNNNGDDDDDDDDDNSLCSFSSSINCNKYQIKGITTTTTTTTTPTQIPSTISTTKRNLYDKRKNSKGLLDITIKTIKLIKRNQLLQKKLAQLQLETRAFIESVMSNPENRALRDKMETMKNTDQ